MKPTRGGKRFLAMIAVSALAATPVLAQGSQGHDGHSTPIVKSEEARQAPQPNRMMMRMAALDARIATLVTEMRMRSGEPKIEAMADLLAALVERQLAMGSGMRNMHEGAMDRETGDAAAREAPADAEPGGMCAPMW